MPMPLTVSQLQQIFPAAAPAYLAGVVDELSADAPAHGLDTPLRLAHFFAQVRQECGAGLQPVEENLNYSPAALKKFGYYQQHPRRGRAGRLRQRPGQRPHPAPR